MSKKLFTLSSILLPLLLFSFTDAALPSTAPINPVAIMANIIGFIWPLFIGFSIIMFIVAGSLFLTAQGEASKVKDARNALIWGVVGVMVGILAFSVPYIVGLGLGTGI